MTNLTWETISCVFDRMHYVEQTCTNTKTELKTKRELIRSSSGGFAG